MKSGFSIPEVVVVVATIGVLGALVYSRYNYHVAKSRQAEAKNNLIHIASLQKAYLLEHHKYAILSTREGTGWKGVGLRRNRRPKQYACSTSRPGEEMLNDLGFRPRNCTELRYEYWTAAGFIGWEDGMTAPAPSTHPDFGEPKFQMRADSRSILTLSVYIWPDCNVRDLWRIYHYGSTLPEQSDAVSRRVLENCK